MIEGGYNAKNSLLHPIIVFKGLVFLREAVEKLTKKAVDGHHLLT